MPIGFHEIDKRLRVVDRSGGEDAMPQIKDVSAGACCFQDPLGSSGKIRRGAQKNTWIKVTLKRDAVTHAGAGFFNWNAPVHAQHVSARGCHRLQNCRTAIDVENSWYAVSDLREDPASDGQRECFVVLSREFAGPRVEELNHLRTRFDLEAHIGNDRR